MSYIHCPPSIRSLGSRIILAGSEIQKACFCLPEDYRPIPQSILHPKASISDHFRARFTLHLYNRSAILANLLVDVPEFALLCNLIPFRTPVFRLGRYESPTETVCLREMAVIRVDRVLNRPAAHYPNEVTWLTHPPPVTVQERDRVPAEVQRPGSQ